MARGSKKPAKSESSNTKNSTDKKKKQHGKATWKLFDRSAKIAAGVLASQAASLTWRAATGRKPPTSDSARNPEMRTVEAVTWAALAGASIELAKVLVNRRAASYWLKSTGRLPPGMKSLTTGTTGKADSRK